MPGAHPKYPLPVRPVVRMGGHVLCGHRRSFREDAAELVARLNPPLVAGGDLPRGRNSGYVVVVNHYWRPGFPAWWIGLAVSAVFPHEIHWVTTSAWVYADLLRTLTITPLSRWVLRRAAIAYDFTPMPPMPPRPHEVRARAAAVRSLLRYVGTTVSPVVGLAPEGADMPGGILTPPPSGVGRLLYHLVARGLKIVPAGLYEEAGRLHVHFGAPFSAGLRQMARSERDQALTSQTMRAIALCLPERLRGAYA